MYGQIINNYFLRPTYKTPYYYINNVNISNSFPTTDSIVDKNIERFTTIAVLTSVAGGDTIAVKYNNNVVARYNFTTLGGENAYGDIYVVAELLARDFPN